MSDSFDIPVFVRCDSPLKPERRPPKSWIDHVANPWPVKGDVPPSGGYLVPSMWREAIDAAMTVGRDPFAWLAAVPALAWSEIIARRSPLRAYLQRTPHPAGLPGIAGHRLVPNVVYQEGTEKTARALFAYRIGMTMAEWACRGLLGLGPTVHAEAIRPPGAGPGWDPAGGLPDLVGLHWRTPATWLVEAKGARRAGLRELAKGALQLASAGLISGPHARVLCGTSIEDRVFMTIDIEMASGTAYRPAPMPGSRRPGPDEDDAELLDLARSRMLTYYALRALPRQALAIRPVGPAVTYDRREDRPMNLVLPLENDESTRAERAIAQDRAAYERRPPSSRLDMLSGRVPGTDIIIGMSRRLFATCQGLAALQAQLLQSVDQDLPAPAEDESISRDEGATEERMRNRRSLLAEREADMYEFLADTGRRAYEAGRESSWQQLLDTSPPLVTTQPANLLESATPDTYLAIDASTPITTAQ